MREYLKVAVQARAPGVVEACLDEEQVIAFYSGQLDESEMEAVRDHLVECPACLALAREARQFLQAMRGPVPASPSAIAPAVTAAPWHRRHRRELFLLAAMVLLAIGAVVWRGWLVRAPSEPIAETPPPSSATPQPRENPWRDLEIAKAEYEPVAVPLDDLIWRDEGGETPGRPAPGPFARAMRPYQRDDFAEAERRLARLVKRNPRHAEAHFYRGVSLLVLGRTDEAVAPLEAAIAHGQGRVSDEARWYLALAYLKTDDPAKAMIYLDTLIESSGSHSAEARRLEQQVRERLNQ